MTNDDLAALLLRAVRAQRFDETPDAMRQGAPVSEHPSIDLAVAAFPRNAAPVYANVLFSREHPQGLIADLGAAAAVRNVSFHADLQDEQGRSVAWLPGSDWARLPWQHLCGSGAQRFVAPYPASLLKLMVLIGVARLVDQGRSAWSAELSFEGQVKSIGDWAFDMTTISCNSSTSALVMHLHACGAIRRVGQTEVHNELHQLFESLGLFGLRLANTRADGGWGNAAGAGVGHLQMTAWDSLRLLWWLDAQAPAAPWLTGGHARLLGASLAHVMDCLEQQTLHEILSSATLRGLPGWVAGLPADDLLFAHKTGNTENYSADAGIARGIAPAQRHYLIAMTSNLGSRYAPHPDAATSWKLPALGAAIDSGLRTWLGD
ncbi:serine hydrolase [Roseateles sp.]|uniref:serine hydrolase n=1 Tax=Roseateles sp. TaxID=1971397 RepID=UPI00286BE62B|nr:serine hydrolase [Roseateles sp.]